MSNYIDAIESISSQNTFNSESFLDKISPLEGDFYSCIKPDYKQYIPVKQLRRMSQVIRMGVACAKSCLDKSKIDNPDAITIGTSLGCVTDTLKFLNNLNENNETLLNPTAFIQSTHNTVSGQIALMLGCNAHNLTFSQQTLSFENALIEALMILDEKKQQNILVGGLDEITPEVFSLLNKAKCYNHNEYVPGEGASFFILSNSKSAKNIAQIKDVLTINEKQKGEFFKQNLLDFLAKNKVALEQIDVLITGDGKEYIDEKINEVIPATGGQDIHFVKYKHLVGEYDTASAFGLWLATKIIQNQKIPKAVLFNKNSQRKLNNVLIYNTNKRKQHSFILITAC
jgi:3-oxoacyl-[acyl-carrier-protein] synthase II